MKGVAPVHKHAIQRKVANGHGEQSTDEGEKPMDISNPKLFLTAMHSFKTESSLDENGTDVMPWTYSERQNAEFLKKAAGRVCIKWEKIAGALLKKGNWARLGQLAKSLSTLEVGALIPTASRNRDQCFQVFSDLEMQH